MIKRILCVILASLFLFFSFVQTIAAEGSEIQPEFDNIVPEEGEPQFGDTRVVIPPMIFPPDNITGIDGLGLDVSWNLRYRNGRGNLYTPSYLELVTKSGANIKNYVHMVEDSRWYRPDLVYGEYISLTKDSIIQNDVLLSAGSSFTIFMSGMTANLEIQYNDVPWTILRPDLNKLESLEVYLYDRNSNRVTLPHDNIIITQGESVNTFNLEIRIRGIDFDIHRINLYWTYYPEQLWPDLSKYMSNDQYTYVRWFGFAADLGNIDFYNENSDAGVFWWLGRLFDAILYIPNLIVDLILDGLSDLFVPTEEFLVSFRDKFDVLFSERFGAVYQSAVLVDDLYDGLTESDEQDSIHFPSTTLSFEDTDFTFGGYDVKVVPEGFEFLAEICKKAISIVCTILFVNGLKKRYEELIDK